MKKTFKGFYLLVSSVVITLLHLPFAFAKLSNNGRSPLRSAVASATVIGDSTGFGASFKSVYDSLHLDLAGLSTRAFEYAQKGWEKLVRQGKIGNQSVIAIADFSQPSSQKRLYVLDLKNYKVLFNTFVAHGRNSGREFASSFSNRTSSFKSSPGFYVTGAAYRGQHGTSLRLEGVERGINDNAFDRAIVMHGAEYVDESWVKRQGYIGRSLGCPAVPADEIYPIVDALGDGACLFIYTPDQRYISRSGLLNG